MFGMLGMNPVELAIAVGMLLFFGLAALGSRTTKLVLQKLVAHDSASGEAMPVIELVGRQQGIISFLLTLVGISPITDFRVTPDELCCNSTSLFGRQNQSVPLRAVSSVAAGVRKPVSYLFVGFAFLVVGVFGGLGVLWNEGLYKFFLSLMVCGSLAGLFIWLYAINKRFFVSVYTQGGPPILLSLKPNVIEGVPLDLDRALQVVKIIRDRIVASTIPAQTSFAHAVPTHATIAAPITVPSPNGQQSVRAVADPVAQSPSLSSAYEYDDYSVGDAVSEQPEPLLQQARDLIKQGNREDAISVLREIILRFPASAEATVAKATLQKAGISV